MQIYIFQGNITNSPYCAEQLFKYPILFNNSIFLLKHKLYRYIGKYAGRKQRLKEIKK